MATALLSVVLAAAALPWGAERVASVSVEARSAIDVERIESLIDIDPGDALSRLEIRNAVQALIASGEVEDVTVTVTPTAEGAVLLFDVQPASRVGSFVLVGLPRSEARKLRSSLGIVTGQPFSLPVFLRELSRAQARLQSTGYPQARLEPELDFETKTGLVRVVVTGTPGPARRVIDVAAPGSRLARPDLWKITGIAVGEVLSDGDIELARRSLIEHLRRRGFWAAESRSPELEERPRGVVLTITVALGPSFTLDLDGLESSKALYADALPFVRGEEPFEEVALEAYRQRLRLFLEGQGRLLSEAEVVLNWVDPDHGVLAVKVRNAQRTPIIAVRFPGLHTMNAENLRDRIGARPGRPWKWGREPVDDSTLAADRGSVLATLQAEGFADASVAEPLIVAEGGGVAIDFPVVMGPRLTVAAVTIAGLPEGVDVPALPARRGGPFSPRVVESSRVLLRTAVERRGFPDAQVMAGHECKDLLCEVRFEVRPGLAVEVGRIVTSGLARTREGIVGKVAGIETGEPFSTERLLEAQRRLLGLGIFQGVAIKPIPGQKGGTRRGVLLDLKEGPSRAFGFGLGYDTAEKVRVSLSWSELNLLGSGRSLSFESRFSSRERRLQLSFREPARLGIRGFPTWVSIYRTEEDYASFSIFRRGMWVEVGNRQRRPAKLLLRYDYQIVQNDAPEEILSQLEREQQSLKIASLTPILEWDTRDDLFSPRTGAFANLALQTAFKAFNADAPFEKVYGSAAAFFSVGRNVFATSVRFGAIEPLSPRVETDGPCEGSPIQNSDNLLLPINVRLFAGGRVSHRAFPTDRLGIPCQTLDASGGAVGGAGLVLSSVEWRFPIFGALGGEIFVDGGNVWPAWRDIAVAQMRWGGGFGLRIETPVGPLRLEYGWKFDRRADESPGELFLSLGNPF